MKTNVKNSITIDENICYESKHYIVLFRKDGIFTVTSKKQLFNTLVYKEFYFLISAIQFIDSIEF